MKTKFTIILLLLTSLFSFSQQLMYKSGGRIYDSNNKKMSPPEVRELLASKPGLLAFYNAGRSKKDIGNVMLYGGLVLLASDFLLAANSESEFPTALTYGGILSVLLAIPIKIGFSKKIKTVVKDYNKQLVNTDSKIKIENISLYTNQQGLGIQMSF